MHTEFAGVEGSYIWNQLVPLGESYRGIVPANYLTKAILPDTRREYACKYWRVKMTKLPPSVNSVPKLYLDDSNPMLVEIKQYSVDFTDSRATPTGLIFKPKVWLIRVIVKLV